MTEFAEEVRQRCRHLRCRTKLPVPVTNPREAFCTRGCHTSFYRRRCLVCEKPIERTTPNRKICKRSKCRNALATGSGFGRFFAKPTHDSQNLELTQETAAAQPVLSATSALGWRQIAGPLLTPDQLRAATVPDGPNGQWKGGEFERIEVKNRAMLKAHFAKQAKECLIQPHHPPVNIVGGYRFPAAPAVDLSPVKPASFKSAPVEITGDGLDIPKFLRWNRRHGGPWRDGRCLAEA
jgi:hypothetical protein